MATTIIGCVCSRGQSRHVYLSGPTCKSCARNNRGSCVRHKPRPRGNRWLMWRLGPGDTWSDPHTLTHFEKSLLVGGSVKENVFSASHLHYLQLSVPDSLSLPSAAGSDPNAAHSLENRPHEPLRSQHRPLLFVECSFQGAEILYSKVRGVEECGLPVTFIAWLPHFTPDPASDNGEHKSSAGSSYGIHSNSSFSLDTTFLITFDLFVVPTWDLVRSKPIRLISAPRIHLSIGSDWFLWAQINNSNATFMSDGI